MQKSGNKPKPRTQRKPKSTGRQSNKQVMYKHMPKGNFTLCAHLVSAFTVPAGGVRQINIAPTPNLFNRIFTQAPNFQSFIV